MNFHKMHFILVLTHGVCSYCSAERVSKLWDISVKHLAWMEKNKFIKNWIGILS